ncbi:MAG: uroporphyrinogen-III C-methyltransferase [Eubacteriales bacterium]|nr:uroporphyrinogen-III C-methyltransferase [Eubacteriales bacterium]
MGHVTLVGAGPGDPGLLTVKGRQAILNADVVVYDRLVGPEILALMPSKAECIDVGKKSNHHPVPQWRINEILLEKAREGKRVVRLKGGDCFLFGRGGEELELLVENGIDFDVVPGVTSALAVPAYAGIPVTHRDFTSSVHIITGHAKAGSELDIDFDALVRHKGTLVFLMSVSSTPMILHRLMQAGMSADMPAAMIERGTLPGQRKVVATVGTLVQEMQKAGIESPAILIVGSVCALSDGFDWYDKLPLHGVTVAVTRPKQRAGTLTERLRRLGADVISYPCIETETIWPNMPVVEALASMEQYHWLVLTSPAGVDVLVQLLNAADMDMRSLAHMKVAVIGAGTAKKLKEHGLRADYIPAVYDSVHLAEGLIRLVQEGERVLMLRAEIGTPELPELLAQACVSFDDVPVYRTLYHSERREEMAAMLADGSIDYITFTSASTVHGFVESLPEGTNMTGFTALCIGPSTEKAAKAAGMHTITAANATIDAMLMTLQEEYHK